MIVVLGTGRCGTSTISKLLDLPHEIKPVLTHDSEPLEVRLRYQLMKQTGGDVGFFYINVIDRLLEIDPTIKVVILQRDRDSFIESLHNHLTLTNTKLWHEAFPRRNFDTKKDLGDYYDWYYRKCTHIDGFRLRTEDIDTRFRELLSYVAQRDNTNVPKRLNTGFYL